MNPLSSMGRGVKSRGKLAESDEHMRRIHDLTSPFSGPGLEVVHIRFPNDDGLPLAGCEAGTIIYVFTGGAVTVCPYLVFAARTPQSRHDPGEFIVGNIFTDSAISDLLDAYNFGDRYHGGRQPDLPVVRHRQGSAARAARPRSSPPASGSGQWTQRSAR